MFGAVVALVGALSSLLWYEALALAQQKPAPASMQAASRWGMLGQWLLEALIFGIVGVAILIVAYYVWELITPYSVKKVLIEDKNLAAGVVVAAFIIGTAIIIAAAIGG